MTISLPTPRHTIEKSASSIRVTLPSKKNVFQVLWFGLWLFGWGFMVYSVLYVASMIYQAFALAQTSTPEMQLGSGFMVIGAFLLVFLLAMLAMGAVAIYGFLWLIAGKEVFEANPKSLSVSRRIFGWNRIREYSAKEVKDLRPTIKQPGFAPARSIQKLLGLNGIIAFNYGTKTFRFGLEIDEAEAKQIILAIKEGFRQENAG